LDEAGDAAPPDIRNRPQERLGASKGVNLGVAAREREAAPPRVAWESQRHLNAWEGAGGVKPGE